MHPGLPRIDPEDRTRAEVIADALERRLKFAELRPGFKFYPPMASSSGNWEVHTPSDGVLEFPGAPDPTGSTATYMMNVLDDRYPL